MPVAAEFGRMSEQHTWAYYAPRPAKERTSMQELRDRLIALRERIAHVLVRL
jgi:hypothetical protein